MKLLRCIQLDNVCKSLHLAQSVLSEYRPDGLSECLSDGWISHYFYNTKLKCTESTKLFYIICHVAVCFEITTLKTETLETLKIRVD